MNIASISVAVPSIELSNTDVVELVRRANSRADDKQLELHCKIIDSVLRSHGADRRFVRNVAAREPASPLVRKAATDCLAQAGVRASEVDLLIYCGVGRAFAEPANAALVCAELGIFCDNFDLSEACMSWVRALQVSMHFLNAGTYKRILIVNGEFNVSAERLDFAFQLKSKNQMRYSVGSLTMGEAAAATLLVPSPNAWQFHFVADPSKYDLCTIPLPGFEAFLEPSKRVGLNGADHLVSFGSELFKSGESALFQLVETYRSRVDESVILIPHAATARPYENAAEVLGIQNKMFTDVFPKYGNIVSASIPAGIKLAHDTNRLRRGERMALCPVSAGMTTALVDAIF